MCGGWWTRSGRGSDVADVPAIPSPGCAGYSTTNIYAMGSNPGTRWNSTTSAIATTTASARGQ